jgi:antitoxin CcdA
MQIKDVRPEPFTKQIRCDRCGCLTELGEVEFHESVSIDVKAGYGSIFGDGNAVQIDLCQHCFKQTLGRWLRVVEPEQHAHSLERYLSLFDPDRHGGEFPTAADAGLMVPEDLPVQERPPLDVDQAETVDLFPTQAQPRQNWTEFEQMDADAQAVLAAIEVRNDQGICTVADSAEHSVIKNLRRSIQERLESAAEFNEALSRRLIDTKERLDKESN